MDYNSLLEYAYLMDNNPSSFYWLKGTTKKHFLSGFEATIWHHHLTNKIVVTIEGRDSIRDIIASFKQRFFGYPQWILDWIDQINPNVLIGHSGGGGIASWLCGQLAIRTITFNAGRTKWSQHNFPELQTNVYVRGDTWGDPYQGLYGNPLPGKQMALIAEANEPKHPMSTIITALKRLL